MHEGVDGLTRDKTRPSRVPPLAAETVDRVVALFNQAPPHEATHWTASAMAKVAGISPSSVRRRLDAARIAAASGAVVQAPTIPNSPRASSKRSSASISIHRIMPWSSASTKKAGSPGARPDPARAADAEGRCTMTHLIPSPMAPPPGCRLDIPEGGHGALHAAPPASGIRPLSQHRRARGRGRQGDPCGARRLCHSQHPRVKAWLARHRRVTFHFTPTSCSWATAVEGWFAKLTDNGSSAASSPDRRVAGRHQPLHRRCRTARASRSSRTESADAILAAVTRGRQALEAIH